jgi:hypothetical protein
MSLFVVALGVYAIWFGDLPAAIVCAGLAVWRGYRGPGQWLPRLREVMAMRRQ